MVRLKVGVVEGRCQLRFSMATTNVSLERAHNSFGRSAYSSGATSRMRLRVLADDGTVARLAYCCSDTAGRGPGGGDTMLLRGRGFRLMEGE